MLTDDEVSTWTAALRSDEYPQGRRAMCRETPRGTVWDPLGVLVNEIWDGYWVLAEAGVLYKDLWGFEVRGCWYWTVPPVSVARVSAYLMRKIIQQNDQCELSFHKIADWIESQRDALTKEAE